MRAERQVLDLQSRISGARNKYFQDTRVELARLEDELTSSRYKHDERQNVLQHTDLDSPMDGIVTRRNIEEGENVVVGTMNNAGTVLLTIADMSVIEAELDVDETDIPDVQLGQTARVTIDAVPDRTFRGRVTEIGNSPIQPTGQADNATNAQATNFKVAVTIEEEVPDIRPGFTCTAEITTATRTQALAVPIQALTVRELLYDAAGKLVREPPPPRPSRFRFFGGEPAAPAAPPETPPGHARMETEGVFVFRDNRAVFVPVKVGIAGERYFEVLSGLAENDRVITGPFNSVRELADGSEVRIQQPANRQ